MSYDIVSLVFTIAILLYSIIIHEISHGYAAYLYGDTTAKDRGRLSFNPVPHIDPIGSIAVPLILIIMRAPFLFGWAKPVPINPYNFRNRRQAEIMVSFAGPLSNLILIVLFMAVTKIFMIMVPNSQMIFRILFYGIIINFVLAIFNLFPIPPLDGSHIIRNIFLGSVEEFYQKIEPFGFIILLGLIYFGVFGWILNFLLRYFIALLSLILAL